MPLITSRTTIKLMDKDDLYDETVGSVLFDMKNVIEGAYEGLYFWKNIYGSPMNQSKSDSKVAMNENPEIASNWKGRVLMQISCEETDKPEAKVMPIDEDIVQMSRAYLKKKEY
jgi:hypothetical protein